MGAHSVMNEKAPATRHGSANSFSGDHSLRPGTRFVPVERTDLRDKDEIH